MKVRVIWRNGSLKRILGTSMYESFDRVYDFASLEELMAKFSPKKQSENLLKALEEAFEGKRKNLTYNFGRGNALFLFNQ